MINFDELDRRIDAQLPDTLKELEALCRQPSIAAQGTGMEACSQLVADMLSRRGFQVDILDTGGHPAVMAERAGTSEKTLLFYNHYDVQPPEPLELWTSPPFEPTQRQGKLFARGVSDDKGHISCRLAAIDAYLDLADELPCNIKFIIEGEEEIGSPNLDAFIRNHQDQLAADACIWEFGGVNHEGQPVLYAGLRGILYVELSAQTATLDAHSGLGGSIFPNAAWRLTWALNSLKDQDERILLPNFYDPVKAPTEFDLELLEAMPDQAQDLQERFGIEHFIKGLQPGLALKRETIFSPTCTICGLTSGYQGEGPKTVLPAEARAKVDFRLVPDQEPEEVLDQLRQHLDSNGFSDIELVVLGSEPPGRTDPANPFIQMVAEAAEPVYGQTQLIQPLSGGSGPIHPFIEYLHLPVATAGISHSGSRVHAPDENIIIDELVRGIKHTARIMGIFGASE